MINDIPQRVRYDRLSLGVNKALKLQRPDSADSVLSFLACSVSTSRYSVRSILQKKNMCLCVSSVYSVRVICNTKLPRPVYALAQLYTTRMQQFFAWLNNKHACKGSSQYCCNSSLSPSYHECTGVVPYLHRPSWKPPAMYHLCSTNPAKTKCASLDTHKQATT